ncbi:MAG: RluA family pseudouridine synthase [Lachnospiraceae bacterium]|nr:RluA family pseudouridine synthase [Lachnospiraceae bacterium]
MKEFVISKNEAGQRFDKYIAKRLPHATTGFIYKMLRKKNFVVNAKKADGKEILKTGDVIRFYLSDETYEKFAKTEGSSSASKELSLPDDLNVIYEDDDILIFSKPAGMLSQKASQDDVSLNEYLISYLVKEGKITKEELETFRPSVCNRLDRNTSGLILCGKSLSGSQYLSRIIKDHSLEKYYRTIVLGRLTEHILLEGYMTKDEAANKVSLSRTRPKEGEAAYLKTEVWPERFAMFHGQEYTLCKVKIYTGKSHQIRAQLADRGFPLAGDGKYMGKRKDPLSEEIKNRYQILHAYRVVFPNDDRYRGMEVVCDDSKILDKALWMLGE